MIKSNTILQELEKAVYDMAPEQVEYLFLSGKTSSFSDSDLVSALSRGLDAARTKLGNATSSVAEFLLSIDALKRGLHYLTAHASTDKNKPRVVIAVVHGDVHDLGANIIAGVLEAMGYETKNLGIAHGTDHIIHTAKAYDAQILGLSSMMSTTLEEMKQTIKKCHIELPATKIIAGGAALGEDLAIDLGADAYCASVVELPQVLEVIEHNVFPDRSPGRKFMDYDRKIQFIEPEIR